MLKNKIKQHISEVIEEQQSLEKNDLIQVEIYKEEKDYVEKLQLISEDISENITLVEKKPASRFSDAKIERCDKESEELIAEETATFLNQPITFFMKHRNEFIYLESNWFEMIGVDAVSLEKDDVFGTYGVLLGLKLKKKFETSLKEHLRNELLGDETRFALMFNHDEGLWNLNFALNYLNGFKEELSIGEAYVLIYRFLFKLVVAVEEDQYMKSS
jgi:hypothetical protein